MGKVKALLMEIESAGDRELCGGKVKLSLHDKIQEILVFNGFGESEADELATRFYKQYGAAALDVAQQIVP